MRELSCVHTRVWTQDRQSALNGAAPRATPQPARGSLRVAVDYVLLGSNLDAMGAFFARSRRACGMWLRECARVFLKDFALRQPQNAKNFPASQGRTVTVPRVSSADT